MVNRFTLYLKDTVYSIVHFKNTFHIKEGFCLLDLANAKL